MAVQFGGPDRRSVEILRRFRHGLFLSEKLYGLEAELGGFINAEYLEKAGGLFGRQTPDSLSDFRQAARGALDDEADSAVALILQYAVQRLRNYGQVLSLRAALFDYARIVASKDGGDIPLCAFLHGKRILLVAATVAVKRLTEMSPEEQCATLHAANPIDYIRSQVTGDIVNSEVVLQGKAIPPFFPRCACRLEGVF
jgi:hypothetical protein